MENKIASIELIDKINVHPNAELLEIADVLGYKVCVKKGEFTEKTKCVFIQVDSVLEPRPEYEFLKNKDYRIRVIRLRKQISQGICFPLSVFNFPEDYAVGTEVCHLIGAAHYEKPLSPELAGIAKGGLPGWLIRTDELNLRSYPEALPEFSDKLCYLAKKADGSSLTAYLKGEEFGVCSRGRDLVEVETNSFWKVARKYKLEEALRAFRAIYPGDFAVQGELVGPGIQGNPMKLTELTMRVFNLFSIDKRKYSHYETLVEFCADNNLPMVDIVWAGKFNFTLPELIEMANKTEYSPGNLCEGLVLRPCQEQDSEALGKRLSVKIISEEYCLKHNQ